MWMQINHNLFKMWNNMNIDSDTQYKTVFLLCEWSMDVADGGVISTT